MEAAGVHKSPVNAGMIGKNWSICASQASAFRQQDSSGTAGHGLFRLCPAMHAELPKALLALGLLCSGLLIKTGQVQIHYLGISIRKNESFPEL